MFEETWRTGRTSEEILAEHPFSYFSSYKRCTLQRDMLSREYDELRDNFISCENNVGGLKAKIESIIAAGRLPMTAEELKGYGNYEKRCLEKIREIAEK